MQITRFDILCGAIKNNIPVLTPNVRLTRELSNRYNLAQTETAWPSPNILPLTAWLMTLWREAQYISEAPLPPLLSDRNEHTIWRSLLQSQSHHYALDKLTQQIKTAWSHCVAWQVSIDKTRFSYNHETLFFYQIVQSFKKATQHSQPSSTLLSALCELIITNHIAPPSDIILAYFDDFTPLQTHFFDLLKDKGTNITLFNETISPSSIGHATYTDKETETLALVHWLEKKVEEGHTQIAVVAPDLDNRRLHLERTLFSFLSKEQVNFSMGKPLLTFSVVSNALALLKMKTDTLSLPTLHLLLFSPYLARENSSHSVHIEIYNRLRKTGEKYFSLQHIIQLLKDHSFAETLRTFLEIEINKTQPISSWCSLFRTCLNTLGFPGNTQLSSEEYQTLAKWDETLREVAKLDDYLSTLNFKEAINWLEWFLTQTLFQAESQQEPVQVLGLLEALGLQFDAIWIMGLTEEAFPRQTDPSPFIPFYLQKEENMPHSSLTREYDYAKTILKRLTQSAPTVVLSHYQKDGDHTLEPTSLIKSFSPITLPIKIKKSDFYLESYEPNYQLPPLRTKHNKGGTFLLKEQAKCPFRAYARFRLQLTESREPTEGLDELDRGILIHEVLEHFWGHVKTQKKLLSLNDSERELALKKAINTGLDSQAKHHPLTLTKTFKSLEIQRLTDILLRWLQLEAQRPPFEVLALESKQTLNIGALEIHMRADRIDRLETGEKMLIDYKTGSPSVSSWFQERIDEPQLPLYALTDNDITTLAFASLKSQDIKFKGISESDVGIKGIKPIKKIEDKNSEALKAGWHKKLSLLAEEFCEGHIEPSPNTPSLCQQCEFKSLCGKNRDC